MKRTPRGFEFFLILSLISLALAVAGRAYGLQWITIYGYVYDKDTSERIPGVELEFVLTQEGLMPPTKTWTDSKGMNDEEKMKMIERALDAVEMAYEDWMR